MPGGIDNEPKIHSSLRQCPSIHSPTQVGGQLGGVTMQWEGKGRRYNLPVWTQSTGFVNTEVGSGKVYHVIVRGQTELSFS